jgi:hypothetical protein
MRIPCVIDNETRKLRAMIAEPNPAQYHGGERTPMQREDLRLICLEFVGGG